MTVIPLTCQRINKKRLDTVHRLTSSSVSVPAHLPLLFRAHVNLENENANVKVTTVFYQNTFLLKKYEVFLSKTKKRSFSLFGQSR